MSTEIERSQLIDELVFLSMKYARIMNDMEFYGRLSHSFNVPSPKGEQLRDNLYEDAKREWKMVGLRMENIRRALVLLESPME